MRLSEIRKVLEKAEALAKQMGNDDPDITFWHSNLDPTVVLDLKVNPVMDDCQVLDSKNPGNFSFQVVEQNTK